MAFKFGNRVVNVPESLENTYLVPFAWFKYGLENGFISISDPKFFDSLQGSMYLECEDKFGSGSLVTKSGYQGDVWLVYCSGSGEIGIILAREGVKEVKRPNRKPSIIKVMSMDTFSRLSPLQQKVISKQYIALFNGCGVKLEQSVWFF